MHPLSIIKDGFRQIRVKYIRERLQHCPTLEIEGKTIIVAPHPDDEVLGCGGMIARLAGLGNIPHMIIMTGGGGSHRQCCGTDDNTIIENRRQLTRNAMKILGIPEENFHFLDFPDGQISESNAETTNLKRLLRNLSPANVFVPHWGEGWNDHVETAHLVRSIIPRHVTLYEYCVWMWYYNVWHLDWQHACQLIMTKEEYSLKMRAVDTYILPEAPCGNPWSGVLPKVFVKANGWNRELYFKMK